MASIAFASLAAFVLIPPSLWDGAARHGRYSGLGRSNPPSGKIPGNAPAAGLGWFLGTLQKASMRKQESP